MGSSSTLSLGSGSEVVGVINGSSSGNGSVNTSGDVLFESDIGSTNSIALLEILSGSSVTFNGNISANNITIAGAANLGDVSKTITGNVAGSGAGVINLANGSHTVSGNFTANSGDTISLNVLNTSSSGNISAAGAAMLSSSTNLNVSLSSTDIGGSVYTIVSGGSGSAIDAISDGNINIDDSGTNRAGSLVFTTYTSGNNLVLRVGTENTKSSSNSGEDSVYNAINSFTDTTGTLYTMQRYLDSSFVGETQKVEAIKSLTPQADNSVNRSVFNSTTGSVNVASNRLESLRNADSASTGFSSGDNSVDKNIWVQQFGSSVDQGNMIGSEGYKSNSIGMAMGMDREISDVFILGFGGSYSKSKIKTRSGTKGTEIDTYQANIYSGYNFGKYFINSILGVALNEYSSNRSIAVANSIAIAKYSGQSYIGRIESGFDHKFKNNLIVTPSIIVTAAQNRVSEYSEGGAGELNLNVKNNRSNFLETRFATELSREFKTTKGAKIYPSLNASYGYDFAATKQVTNSNFIGRNASFEASGSKVVQGSYRFGTGLKANYNDAISVGVNYDYDYKKNYQGHTGSVKFKYNF